MAAVRANVQKAPTLYPGKVARASLATFQVPTINNDVNVGCRERKASLRVLVAN